MNGVRDILWMEYNPFGDLKFQSTCLLLQFFVLCKFLLQILLGFDLCFLDLDSYVVVNE